MISRFLLLLSALVLSTGAFAQLNCADLGDVADVLDDVYVMLEDVTEFEEGSELDQALGGLIDGVELIAESEQDARLDDAVNLLARGWDEYDLDLIESGISLASSELNALYVQDCE